MCRALFLLFLKRLFVNIGKVKKMGKITKKKAEELMSIKGEVRGIALKSHASFIIKEKGEEALKELQQEMKRLGCSLDHKKIESMKFYPVGIEALELFLIKEIFEFEDEKFEEIGAFGAKSSLIVRLFTKYLFSVKALAKHGSKIWSRYYTEGELEVREMDPEKGRAVIQLRGFQVHRYHCLHVKGFLTSVLRMALGGKPLETEETKCMGRGDEYHEFVVTW